MTHFYPYIPVYCLRVQSIDVYTAFVFCVDFVADVSALQQYGIREHPDHSMVESNLRCNSG